MMREQDLIVSDSATGLPTAIATAAGLHTATTTTANSTLSVPIAGLQREQLTGYAGVGPLARIVDNSIHPGDALQALLCDQLAAAHNAAMRLISRASVIDDVQQVVKLTAAAARMMTTFQAGLLVLDRVRSGAEQPALVQQVNVSEGGQAIVATNMNQGWSGVTK